MSLKKLLVNNYTVFDKCELDISSGINVFVGENGTGKTHLLKLLYSAIMSANGRVTFANKLVRTMLPLQMKINRLINENNDAWESNILIGANGISLGLKFNEDATKWNAVETGVDAWEKELSDVRAVFIPAKEVLSNNYNLNAAVERGNVEFDDTYLDILNAAKIDVSKQNSIEYKEKLMAEIAGIIGGEVIYDPTVDTFFLEKDGKSEEFNLVSEGIRKLSLLWLLVKNGALEKGSVLFWDEPEANINPAVIPVIAKLIIMLQRNGVQVFIATHDYFLCKYLEVERNVNDSVMYHSLYKDNNGVNNESANKFTLLEHNSIMQTFVNLYRDEVEASLR